MAAVAKMRTLVPRTLTVFALMAWQGGFLFYAAFVVRIGQGVLGSHFAQGMITQQVTVALNGVGAAALALMVVDALRADRLRRALWGAMALLLGALFLLHRRMDG